MKNKTITRIILLALPLFVVLVASSPTGVTVFDGKTAAYFSWMQIVPESNWGWCAPVAALMNYALFALAVLYALARKKAFLRGIYVIAAAATCIAVLPIMVQSDVKIVPNVFGAILLCAQGITAYLTWKSGDAEEENKPKGNRLNLR